MKLDEIGKTIKTEELTGVLNNLRWQGRQRFLLVDVQGKAIQTPLSAINDRYVQSNGDLLALCTAKEQSLAALKADLRLKNYFLKNSLEPNQYLWPLAVVGGGSDVMIRLPEELFTELYNRKFKKYKVDYYDFRNQIYLKIAQGMESVGYLLTYLTGATPFQWDDKGNEKGRARRSWRTKELLDDHPMVDYRTLESYLKTQNGVAKVKLAGNFDQNQGITGLILKNIDFNPATELAIGPNILELINVLIGYFLMGEGIANDQLADKLEEARQKDLVTALENPFKHPQLEQEMRQLLEDVNHFAQEFGYGQAWEAAYQVLHDKVEDVMQTPAAQILRKQGADSSFEYVRKTAIKLQEQRHVTSQLSDNSLRILQAAFVRGIEYQVVDANTDLVQINAHFVQHGLQSDQDPAVLATMWDNKQLAKQMVSSLAVQTQQAWKIKNADQAARIYPLVKNKAITIKNAQGHTSQNGVVYRLAPSRREFLESVNLMLKETPEVLVEQVISGSAYQAVILNGKVVGLIERIPENVVGNGRDSIGKLIADKGIEIGRNEHYTLTTQGIELEQTSQRGIQTLLRYDAFSGTQFESFDALDDIDSSYIELLQQIANKLQMQDGFIDVIISNLYQEYTPEHPELVTFLSAHASADLSKYEEMLMGQHRDLAGQIVVKFE